MKANEIETPFAELSIVVVDDYCKISDRLAHREVASFHITHLGAGQINHMIETALGAYFASRLKDFTW